MIAFIFGVIFLALIYYSTKAKDEKELRQTVERKSEREKNLLEYKLKRTSLENKAKSIIDKIQNKEQKSILKIIERDKINYNAYNEIIAEFEKRDGLLTTIKSGTSESYKTIKIFEKIPFFPNLEIHYEIFNIDKAHFPKDNLIIENLEHYSDKQVFDQFVEMEKRNEKV